jgi:uncharacterized cupredoxin-like copper-binding protein
MQVYPSILDPAVRRESRKCPSRSPHPMSTIGTTILRRGLRSARPPLLPLIGLIFVAGCTSAGSSAAAGGATINVTVQEFTVSVDKADTAAGSVTFAVKNEGPADSHEFLVIKTDLEPGDLPTDATGAVDEAGAGIEVIGKLDQMPVGTSKTLTLDLAAGKYVLICNVYDPDEQEAHYHEGMRVAFTVT